MKPWLRASSWFRLTTFTFTCGVLVACASWFTPSHILDVGQLLDCVLQNESLPPVQIVTKCGAQNEQQVIDMLSAHRRAAAREHIAACGPVADAGADH